jgi:hypothetical protein
MVSTLLCGNDGASAGHEGRSKMTFKTLLTALTLSLTLVGGASFAADEASLTEAKKAEITALMVAQGYEVRSIQIEDGLYEVYAIKDGATAELYLNDALEMVEGEDD